MSLPGGSPRAQREFEAFLSLEAAGRAPDFEAFAAARAELADELRLLHSDWRALRRIQAEAGVGGFVDEAAGEAPAPVSVEWQSPSTRELLDKLAAHSARGARYAFGDPIGRGGMGEVREAFDVDLRRTLAIKTIQERLLRPSSSDAVAQHELALHRFLEEAQITAQLNHPGIVPVYDLGVDADGVPYFAMARVRGASLHDVLGKVREGEDGWSVTRAVGVLLRVCETLVYAHSRGVVHRDLKPANVMVGSFGEVYVMDWGLAKVRRGSQSASKPGEPLSTDRQIAIGSDPATPLASSGERQPGTVFYMSPEQAGGDADAVGPRSDVYSAGAMLYEVLAGVAPYRDATQTQTHESVRRAVLAGPPRPLSELAPTEPAELVAVAEKAMAREPSARYASMFELAADLRAYLEGRVVRAHRTGAVVEFTKWVARNRATATSIAIGLALVIASLGGSSAVLARKNEELRTTNSDLAAATERANEEARVARLERTKAEEATALAQQRLAESHFQRAALARQRGQWRDVLAALADARAAGYADEVELRLAQAAAHASLLERDLANGILDELLARADLGPRRAEALLIRADLAMSSEKEPDRVLAWAREAREIGLGGADDAYARALLAETSAEALEWIERTLAIDPFHRSARTHEMVLLFFLGRFDDLADRTATAARLFPSDPDPIATRVAGFAIHGDMARARAELERCRPLVDAGALTSLEALVDVCERMDECLDMGQWLGIRPDDPCDERDFHASIASALGKWMIAKRKKSVDADVLPVFDPTLPVLKKGFTAAIRAVQHAMFLSFSKPAELEAELAAALAVHPEGTLHYFRGACLINMHDSSKASMLEYTARAEASFRAAYQTPAILDDVEHAARYWAAYAESILAKDQSSENAPAMRARAIENVEWLLEQDDLIPHECGMCVGFALQDLDSPALAERVVARWSEIAPEDPAIPTARVRVAIAQKAFGRALDLVEPLLVANPASAGLAKLRDDALAGLADDAKRLDAAAAGG